MRVVFYEHAWNGHRNENLAQVQDLASHGFLVVAIDHPGQASKISYSDGTVIRSESDQYPDLRSENGIQLFQKQAKRLMQQREADLTQARSFLSNPAMRGNIAEAAIWDRMGILGFSFGGSFAIQLCASDSSFVAGVNEDGLNLDAGIPQGAFLFMDQAFPSWLNHPPIRAEDASKSFIRTCELRVQNALAAGKQRLEISNSSHLDFSDWKFFQYRLSSSRSALDLHREISSALADFYRLQLGSH